MYIACQKGQANMKAFAYTRCSTAGQANEGVTLEAQKDRAAAWCTASGHELAEVFTDAGISGKKASNRPALQAALDAVCQTAKREGGAALVVYSLSRLARSTKDALAIAERLRKAGADLISLSERIDTGGAAGKLFYTVFAAFAEFERDVIAERTKTALAFKKANGERVGQVPFGFDLAADGVRLIPNAAEQATLADLRTMRAARWTWERISAELNARGLFNKSGSRWTLHNARKVFLAAA